jgi:hypothetical protein
MTLFIFIFIFICVDPDLLESPSRGETPEIFSASGDDSSPRTGTYRSKSVLSRVANAELVSGTEHIVNERFSFCSLLSARSHSATRRRSFLLILPNLNNTER